MTINRVPEVPFAQIANAMLRDTRLSYKARGMLAMVLSNVGDWEAPREWLVEQSERDGRDSVQSALNELTDLGYRRVTKGNDPSTGLFVTIVEWTHEPGVPIPPTDKPTAGKTDGRKTSRSTEHDPEHQSLPKGKDVVTAQTPGLMNTTRLCTLLADLVEGNGSKRPIVSKKWLDSCRLLIDSDGRSPQDVEGAIRWSQQDDFWRGNILSLPSLRKQFDRLRLAAERSQSERSGRNPSSAVTAGQSLVARLKAEAEQGRAIEQ